MLEQDNLNPIVSRRKLLLATPKALIRGYALLKVAEAALADFTFASAASLLSNDQQEVIEADNGLFVPWSTHLWFPLVEDVARRYRIPQIYQFLHQFDEAYRNKYSQSSYAEEWQRDFAEGEDGLLRKLRGAEYLTAGFCHAVANAAVWQTPPKEGETERYGIIYNKEARIAFMAVKHAGDSPLGFTTTRQGIEYMLLDRFPQSRIPLVANMPLGEPGRWFGVIYQVIKKPDAVYVRAKILGQEKVVHISEVKSIQQPDLPQYSRTEPHLNSHWINPEVFKDGGVLLNELINS